MAGIETSAEKAPESTGKRWAKSLGVVAAIAIPLIGIYAMTANPRDEAPADPATAAILECEQAVKQQLKAPDTATFSSRATESDKWTVSGTVSAENSFGATVRSDYRCTVAITGDTATARVDYIE